MHLTSPSRRDFISQGVRLTAAGSLLAAGMSAAAPSHSSAAAPISTPPPRVDHYQLLNVRLEEGFEIGRAHV